MNKQLFIIYGAGNRGKRLLNYITPDYVSAFIDRDEEKQKETYCGKPVISLEKYNKEFADRFIIQSIDVDSSVGKYLEENGIYQYSELFRLPGEFAGWGKFDYKEVFSRLFSNRKCVYLYDINAMSLLAKDYCCQNGIRPVIVTNDDKQKLLWLERYTNCETTTIDMIDKDTDIFITEERQENQIPWNHIVKLYDFKPFYEGFYFNSKIGELHNCKKGEKCFIVATGPSLRMEDLAAIKEHKVFSFGLNSIIKIKEQWLPDALVCVDSGFQERNKDLIDQYPASYVFLSDVEMDFPWVNRENYYRLHCVPSDYYLSPTFEADLSLQVSFGVTVTFVALQVAAYMGFSEIYLLGVDCNYLKGSQDNHFIKDTKADQEDHYIDGMIMNYQAARDYAEANGIKIYNATRGGALEVFERVDFDSLF